MTTFAQRIQELQDLNGVSDAQLASMKHLDTRKVKRLKDGTNLTPNGLTIRVLARAFGITGKELLVGVEGLSRVNPKYLDSSKDCDNA